MRITVAGDNALMIRFAAPPGPDTSTRIQTASTLLRDHLGDVVVDLVPGFVTLLVVYRPLAAEPLGLRRQIAALLSGLEATPPPPGKLIELPVYYSDESGPDLQRVADHAKLPASEVIRLHSTAVYRVLAIGFAPGFAYLGDTDERLSPPRLATPRVRVPRGAVAVANRHTAVYPQATPGGWNLIGLCPTGLFDPGSSPPTPFQVGDRVRFHAIDRDEFLRLGGEL